MVKYEFEKTQHRMMLYAGDLHALEKNEAVNNYFVITDDKNGKTFIGYVNFLEKELMLTPNVELHMVKRRKVPKNFEVDDKGNITKVVYI